MRDGKGVYSLLWLCLFIFWSLPAAAVPLIQRVPLSDALFVGVTEMAPPAPVALHTIADFETYYGQAPLLGPGSPYDLLLAARSFFEQGGETLYIAQVVDATSPEGYRQALHGFHPPSHLGLIAAPGYGRLSNAMRMAVAATLVNMAETSGHSFAVLELLLQSSVNELFSERAHYATPYAALYAPWVTVYDDQNAGIVSTPASGAVVGVIAKSEIDRGAHMPPAGIALNGLSGLAQYFTDDEVNLLVTNNINPLRWFGPADYKVWGARTLDSSGGVIYINNQRYGRQLELSIRQETEWVTGESNAEPLWTSLTAQIETFLHGEWQRGALVGSIPSEAYFVTCDQSTMTAADIDAGRTICVWGASLLRPAEFSVFTLTHERNPGSIDSDPPAGYTLHLLNTPITTSGSEAGISLQIVNAGITCSFQYIIGSSGGPEILHGKGDVLAKDFQIEIIGRQISTLPDGQISIYFALTDHAGNLGPWISATTIKNTAGNSGSSWSIFLPAIMNKVRRQGVK
ncbi:MAG: phage tail sheath subtilisin-like domain-containing protein [Desulfocapsa sp.]|nr:phage tail sheath subtilisin-like domain-containing protein [Desulfocapsa sp.]